MLSNKLTNPRCRRQKIIDLLIADTPEETVMARFSKFCLSLLLIGLLFIPHALRADIAPLQATGGTLGAKSKHETIRMAAEEVTIRLEKGSYTVDAVFHMVNAGETITVQVGFPRGDEQTPPELGHFPDFTQFHAWVDGKQVQFSKEGDRWLAGQVTFPGNATTTIRIVYEANYYRGRYATYIIGTGSHWKDSIGRAAFTVEGGAIGGTKEFTATLNDPKAQKLLSEQAVRFEVTDYMPGPKDTLRVVKSDLRKDAISE